MNEWSPKIEIINHFDNLINRLDIEIEVCLEKYNEEKILGDITCFENDISRNRPTKDPRGFFLYFNESPSKTNKSEDIWPNSTKVIDYLRQIRKTTIDELRKAQEDSLEYYKSISSQFNRYDQHESKRDEIKSQLFGEKFYFQLCYKPSKQQNKMIFNLYTIVTDFYMSPDDIYLLENMINEDSPYIVLLNNTDSKIIIDEKLLLIGLIQKRFFDNLTREQLPNHVIRIQKLELLDLRSIRCMNLRGIIGVNLTSSSTDLPLKLQSFFFCGYWDKELEDIELEELSFLDYLDLSFDSIKRINIRRLTALRDLVLKCSTNSNIQIGLLDQLQSVQKLTLNGLLSDFNLNRLVNLTKLSLCGQLDKNFNYDLFENICNRLTELSISCENLDDEGIAKMFNNHHFPNLSKLSIVSTKITKLEKKLFNGFPTLRFLSINLNKELRTIDSDSFSNLKQLSLLYFTGSRIESLDRNHFSELINLSYLKLSANINRLDDDMFSNLKNLKNLDLSKNSLEKLNPQSFFGLRNLKGLKLSKNKLSKFDVRILENLPQIKEIYLLGNSIVNKEEIENRVKKSEIYLEI